MHNGEKVDFHDFCALSMYDAQTYFFDRLELDVLISLWKRLKTIPKLNLYIHLSPINSSPCIMHVQTQDTCVLLKLRGHKNGNFWN